MDLQTIWFLIIGALFTGYAILDGFDLGAGPLLFLIKEDRDRRVVLNAIGPIWNGNEVWLVTGVGALFAAFPNAYATVFSGFYDAFMILLTTLIFRAIAIEFRGQRPEAWWKTVWDISFALSSVISAFILGLILGNVIWGVPLNESHVFYGTLLSMLHPYPIFVGVVAVTLCIMHANLYLILKSEGALQTKLRKWSNITIPSFVTCFLALNLITVYCCPHIERALHLRPYLLAFLLVLSIVITLAIRRFVLRGYDGIGFICSCLSIATMMLLFGAAVYPTMVFSIPDLLNSLNIYNSASTDRSLDFMLTIALIGIPIVLSYTITIYYVFRGKVILTDESY